MKYENFGFSMNQRRIDALMKGHDKTDNVYIVVVPTLDIHEIITAVIFHITRWKESLISSFGMIRKAVKENPILIDGRNLFSASELEGIDYFKIG